ncbi:ABC-2 type transport system permease protein [Kribbella amoyensis]|uniref:ABC-2 type transport system permease protein n=1 Tax=Kribbella amoyensis TaxID=996641 RepID=A0A561BZ23_9ACTN|nr:ABC transporter permease [Kribbella amoyensis]TWD83942.1 ABC-2 type transport system permease protein [Kribbella amoyensis]
MKGILQVVAVELRLIVRDPMAAFFALAFPAVLLWVKMRDPEPLPSGVREIDANVPMLTVFVIGLASLVILPSTLAQYRERRILKRLRATPAAPGMLLGAQWVAHLLLAVLGTVVLVVIGGLAFDLTAPASPGKVVLAWILGAGCLGAIGLLIGAVVPTNRSAMLVGLTVFFPMVFVSGAMVPRELTSGSLRTVGDLTPMAPVVETIRAAWSGTPVSATTLIVMATITALATTAAAKVFRG